MIYDSEKAFVEINNFWALPIEQRWKHLDSFFKAVDDMGLEELQSDEAKVNGVMTLPEKDKMEGFFSLLRYQVEEHREKRKDVINRLVDIAVFGDFIGDYSFDDLTSIPEEIREEELYLKMRAFSRKSLGGVDIIEPEHRKDALCMVLDKYLEDLDDGDVLGVIIYSLQQEEKMDALVHFMDRKTKFIPNKELVVSDLLNLLNRHLEISQNKDLFPDLTVIPDGDRVNQIIKMIREKNKPHLGAEKSINPDKPNI